jgi:hypothetical protein
MLPLHKIAARVLGWGAAMLLSAFLAYALGMNPLAYIFVGLFFFFGALTLDWVMAFKFVYENTREHDGSD